MDDEALTERVERLIARLEMLTDAKAKETAREAIAAVLELHKVGLQRVLERLPAVQLKVLAMEPLVGSLLVLHDLHPADLLARVQRAVPQAQVQVDGDIVQLKLPPGANRAAVEKAVAEVAPDAAEVRIA